MMGWQDTVDMTVWEREPDPGLESQFTRGASDDWHAWNEWAPEVEVANFCGDLTDLIRPNRIIETGVSQGFITRRILGAINPMHRRQIVQLFEADPQIRDRMPDWMWVEPEPTPTAADVAAADLLILDSHWPQRISELSLWAEHGKPGSFVFLHDVKPSAPAGSGHRMMAELVRQLGVPTMWFDNPRGSALLYKPDGWETPPIVWPKVADRTPASGTVMIAQIDHGEVSGGFHHSVLALMSYSGSTLHGGPILHPPIRKLGGPRVYAHRDGIVRQFLKTDADWLLSIDSDMVVPANMLEEMLAVADPDERPFIGGHCHMWRGESGPLSTMWGLVDAEQNDVDMKLFEDYPMGGLVKVGATGAAVTLIHRRVFEAIQAADPDYPMPWYEEGFNRDSPVGEDIMFCVRARRAGVPIYVHTGLDVGHEKLINMNREFFVDWRRSRRFVVTGWPRSGTGYVSQLYLKAGVACGHELAFTHDRVYWGTRWGDSSWMAAPHLTGFDGPTIHVVRHPLDVLSSIYAIGFFEPDHPNGETMGPYRRYALTHTGVVDSGNPLATAVGFMRAWHDRIVAARPLLTVKVEDVNPDVFAHMLTLARPPLPTSRDKLAGFLESVPTDWNRPQEGRPPRLTWQQIEDSIPGDLYGWLREITSSLGYDH